MAEPEEGLPDPDLTVKVAEYDEKSELEIGPTSITIHRDEPKDEIQVGQRELHRVDVVIHNETSGPLVGLSNSKKKTKAGILQVG